MRCLSWLFGKKKKKKLEETVMAEESGFRNAPVCDFAQAENRERMQQALARVKSQFGKLDYDLYIGGKWVTSDEQIVSTNPSKSSETIGMVSKAGKAHIDQALESAREAFETWQYTSPEERAGYLYDVAKQMQENLFDLSALVVYEAGKTWKEAHADVNEAIDFLNFYAMEMERLGKEVKTQNILGEDNTTSYIPKGTVAVIAPWNFPLAILAGMTSAAIVTGNTVLMKPASDTPLIAGKLVEMFEKAGLPSGVLNYVPCSGGEVGNYLIESPLVDKVAFTGSRDVGLKIYEKISKVQPGQQNVKTSIMEMGGKNGIILDRSADIDEAIPGILHSAFGYQGQKCSACSRLIIDEAIYDRTLEKLVESAKSLKVGPADSPDTDVGPVISKRAYDGIVAYIEKAKEQQGNVVLEGICSDEDGCYIGPTIIEVEPDNVIAREEVFGPVLAVMKVKGFDQALSLLNDTDYALTGGIYSRTPSHIEEFKRKARIGNRYINRGITGAIVERQPFGGFKMSGAGSNAGGTNYLPLFMYQVTTSEESTRKGHIPGIEDFAAS
jgi:RHH-type proline utilization regulon transcriptional repressor/proline dehydrogenase/delta 1-pyrroline-5-carboxylate dehydrogenase